MVFGGQKHAEALRGVVATVLASLGLRLAPEKTGVAHIVLLTELTAEFWQVVCGAGRVPANLPA
jgi:hypothetical protein